MECKNKRALIIGAGGQDGFYLRKLLGELGYGMWGASQNHLWQEGGTERSDFSVLSLEDVETQIQIIQPDELYYLAAYHHSSQERSLTSEHELWSKSMAVNGQGWINCLLALIKHAPHCRAVYAASSHVFGIPAQTPQTELTPFDPQNIYGISKVVGIQAARLYRRVHCLHASSAIFYNHESILRTEKFVSQKIIQSLYRIKSGRQKELVLGDLGAVTDWGYAPDYVEAMRRMTTVDEADDYIVATGQRHTVADFVELACQELGLAMDQVVREDRQLLGPTYRRAELIGDAGKLEQRTGWKPSLSFAPMVSLLVGESKKTNELSASFPPVST